MARRVRKRATNSLAGGYDASVVAPARERGAATTRRFLLRSVAVLELLPAAAWAGLVAADLGSFAADRHLGQHDLLLAGRGFRRDGGAARGHGRRDLRRRRHCPGGRQVRRADRPRGAAE